MVFEAPEATIALKRWIRLLRRKEVGPSNEKSWAIPASYLGILLVVGGVAGEGIFEFLASRADTELHSHDEHILEKAIARAEAAKDSADAAGKSATVASEASAKAVEKSTKADALAANALTLANGARTEASSFERDIALAKTQAASAESHLADALQRTVQAEAELDRIRTPRSLNNPSALQDALKAFRGTGYTILGCFQDQESIDLLVQIDKVLSDAGWTRGKPTPESPVGDIQLNISKDFAVPTTTRSGIFVACSPLKQWLCSIQHPYYCARHTSERQCS